MHGYNSLEGKFERERERKKPNLRLRSKEKKEFKFFTGHLWTQLATADWRMGKMGRSKMKRMRKIGQFAAAATPEILVLWTAIYSLQAVGEKVI